MQKYAPFVGDKKVKSIFLIIKSRKKNFSSNFQNYFKDNDFRWFYMIFCCVNR